MNGYARYALLAVFAGLFYYEFIRQPASAAAAPAGVSSVPNNPANANALAIPTAPINASTLTPAQLGTGLFEDESGLGSQQPDVTPTLQTTLNNLQAQGTTIFNPKAIGGQNGIGVLNTALTAGL